MRKATATTFLQTLIVLLSTLSLLASPASATAITPSTHPPSSTSAPQSIRRANYFLKEVTPNIYDELAEYDLLILPAELQEYNPAAFAELHKRNSDIMILAYVPTLSYNNTVWFDALHQELLKQIPSSWWLTDPSGNTLSFWPGTTAINITSNWQYTLPYFVATNIMSTGHWDGIFYDEFSSVVPRSLAKNGIDIMKDGKADNLELLDTAWKTAAISIVRYTRELLGNDAIIITNGDSDPAFTPYTNGRMFESFPTPWEGKGRWQDTVASYLRLNTPTTSHLSISTIHQSLFTNHHRINIINGTTSNTGDYTNIKDTRFALTTTFLGMATFPMTTAKQIMVSSILVSPRNSLI
jgi:hypothetical protein